MLATYNKKIVEGGIFMSTKDEILEYVMKSPENTNYSVLKSMLDGISEGGGGSSEISIPIYKIDENTGESTFLETISAAVGTFYTLNLWDTVAHSQYQGVYLGNELIYDYTSLPVTKFYAWRDGIFDVTFVVPSLPVVSMEPDGEEYLDRIYIVYDTGVEN